MMGEKRGMKALELWCRRVTEGYPGVKIENMTTSWRDGLAFCALIHHFRPDLIDFDGLDKRDIYKNNELAFRVAERQLGIPALLDAEDMVEYEVPDRLSILTYLSQFYQTFVSNQQGSTNSSSRSHSSKVPEMISPPTKTQKTPKVSAGRLESCWSCRRPVFLAERLVAGGKLRHRTCFTCKRCGHQLSPVDYYETEGGDFVCERCPDEEGNRKEVSCGKGDGVNPVHVKDEYSLDFESALESMEQSKEEEEEEEEERKRNPEEKCFQEVMERFQSEGDLSGTTAKSDISSVDVSLTEERSVKNVRVTVDSVNDNQYPTASRKKLDVKIKNLLGRDFSDTLSLLNKESDSFIVDITEIIDNIINDAVKKVEDRVEESFNNKLDSPLEEEEGGGRGGGSAIEDVVTGYNTVSDETVQDATKEKQTADEIKLDKMGHYEDSVNYPEDLNPFASDEEEEEDTPKSNQSLPTPRKTPISVIAPSNSHFNESGKKILEAPKVNLNPFWSDGEPSSDEDVTKPVPAPRTSLRTSQHYPYSTSHYGSFTSLTSIASSASAIRRKKGPAPLPPSAPKTLQNPSTPHSIPHSPVSPLRTHRKSRPAPSPPTKTLDTQIMDNNNHHHHKTSPDKSSFGKWKRKKGQAPGLPVPQRRRITPLPMPEVHRELEDLEIKQRELERQGVTIEQTIREYECAATKRGDGGGEEEEEEEMEEGGKDVEGLILQLFEIVNQKNELFRRQAELMLLRRQQRLEEEHADIEYQIRCLMGRPERNKTDSDKAQEEELIRRLVEVVERRNEIIECLDMDRKREVQEDESIHHHLEAFVGKAKHSEEKSKSVGRSPSSLLKYMKKRKAKREKTKEVSGRSRGGGEKAVDDSSREEENVKTLKPKKTWLPKA